MVSARKVRLEHLAAKGDRRAAIALKLARSPNDFLSTVQIGITLIGILSGAVGGATVAQRLTPILAKLPWLTPYAEGVSVALVVTAITYLSLVIGELAPKRIALNAPEAIACGVSPAMRWLSRASAPLVHLLGQSTDRLLHLLGIRVQEEPELTEDEIKALIRQGAESGVFEEAEHAIVQRVFRLGDRPVKSVMTPRTEIVWLNADLPRDEILHKVVEEGYSRYPVGRGRLDACIGTIRGRQLLAASLQQRQAGEAVALEELLQPPLCVAESIRVLDLIGEFRRTGFHIALVTDEYGGIEGLVTVTDLMEAIVGDLPSLEDGDDPPVVRREDGSWLMDGALDVSDFREHSGCPPLPDQDLAGFNTLGGFILHRLGHVPRSGEHFSWAGFRFEVVDMDGQRIDKLLITPLRQDDGDGEQDSDD